MSETPNDETTPEPEAAAEDLDASFESYDSDDSDDYEDAPREPNPVPDVLRPGMVVDGTIDKLVDFGAFVRIPTTQGEVSGLVHVSEVAPGFVENIYAEVGEGDEVEVKVLSIGEDGKIGLSIKQAREDWAELQELDRPVRSKIDKDFDRKLRKFMHGSQSIQGEARRQKRRKLGR